MRSTRPQLAAGAMAAVSCVLGFTFGGAGLGLSLLAVILLGATLQAYAPSLAGPARFGGAVVAFALYVLGAPVVTSLLLDGPPSRAVALIVLALPSLICAGLLTGARLRRGAAGDLGVGWLIAGILGLVVLSLANWLKLKSTATGMAWAMSGDNRNHLVELRSVLDHGGLSIERLKTYPSGAHALAALISAANGRSDLQPADLLTRDIYALASVWILVFIAVAVLSAAAVLLSLPRHGAVGDRVPPTVGIAAVAAGLLVGTGLYSGEALTFGFLPALAGQALLLAGVVLGMAALQRPRPLVATLLIADAVVLVAYRPLYSLLVVPVILLVLLHVALRHRWTKAWTVVALGTLALSGALGTQFLGSGRRALRLSLEAPGAVAAPNIWLIAALGLLMIGILLTPHADEVRAAMIPVLVITVGLVALITLSEKGVSIRGPGLSYSSSKLVWAACMLGCWVVFSCIARAAVSGAPPGRSLSAQLRPLAQTAILSTAAIVAVMVVSPVTSPERPALAGWSRPPAALVDSLFRNLDRGQVVVPWLYAKAPDGVSSSFGDDRMGIFWSLPLWGEPLYSVFNPWAYDALDPDPVRLCPLIEQARDVVILTRDPDLQQRTAAACKGTKSARFVVER